MALTRIGFFNPVQMLMLYKELGSAMAVYEHRNDIRDVVPGCSDKLVEMLKDWDAHIKRAEEEIKYDDEHHIQVLCMDDAGYPQRLKECEDAPIVLYYEGTADLNKAKVINIVGTRRVTIYGQDMIRHFCEQLRQLCPDVLIVSGLAYGVDIHAHRNALANGFETVGVLAHGLDDLYPPSHRATAVEMLSHGGLLSEYYTHTNADKMNFVRRNRIVAGMSDACVLVESAAKGGGLITAELALEYGRDVFAFPGRVGDAYSQGCNNLIRDNRAALLSGAEDLVKLMHWDGDVKLRKAKSEGIELNLFNDLSEEEMTLVSLLQKHNDLQLNVLTVQSGFPVAKVSSLMFQLEMKGIVKTLAGGMYHLLRR